MTQHLRELAASAGNPRVFSSNTQIPAMPALGDVVPSTFPRLPNKDAHTHTEIYINKNKSSNVSLKCSFLKKSVFEIHSDLNQLIQCQPASGVKAGRQDFTLTCFVRNIVGKLCFSFYFPSFILDILSAAFL